MTRRVNKIPDEDLRRQKGIALPAVLGVTMVLLLVVSALINLSLSQKRQVSAELLSTRMVLAAEAAMAENVKALLDIRDKSGALGTGPAKTYGGMSVVISLSSEEGRINLNKADEPLLKAFFEEFGLRSFEARNLARAFLRTRQENGGFNIFGEVLRVPGMTPELLEGMKPDITLYSNGNGIRAEFASERVLKALTAMGEDFTAQGPSVLKPAEFETGTTWRLIAVVESAEGRSTTFTWIIRLTGDNDKPYLVHWRN